MDEKINVFACEEFLNTMTKKDGWVCKERAQIMKAKVIAFYFGAAWCPPARGFTPILRKFYN